MPSIRNVSDRDVSVGNLPDWPAGEDRDVSDEWAASLLTNPTFEPTPKGKKSTDNAQEG
jgi:hypothetical protein